MSYDSYILVSVIFCLFKKYCCFYRKLETVDNELTDMRCRVLIDSQDLLRNMQSAFKANTKLLLSMLFSL